MKTEIKATPYTGNTTEIKIRDLVRVKGFKSLYIVVASDADAVDLLPLLNLYGASTRGGIVKKIGANDLVHYNGDVTISQRI